jgi:hypothetical protein
MKHTGSLIRAISAEAQADKTKDLPPNYRVFVNNGHSGCVDIRSLDDLEFIASEHLRVMTPLGQETAVTLRVVRIKHPS